MRGSKNLGQLSIVATAAVVLCLAHTSTAQSVRPPASVKELTALMAERQLDSIAAADPGNPGRFVAALLLPGVQLLVVSAEYPNAAELQSLIAQRNYRDVYSALHQPVTMPSRVFFLDAGCDGLRPGAEAVDVLYEKGATETLFDGNWRKSGLSEEAYRKRVQEAGGQYNHLVSVLHGTLVPQTADTTIPGK